MILQKLPNESIRLRINGIRIQADLNKKDFAKTCGVQNSYMSDILSGKRTPSLNALIAIVETFEVSLHWLLFDLGEAYISDADTAPAEAFPIKIDPEVETLQDGLKLPDDIIRQRITQIREACKLNKKDFAELIGVHATYQVAVEKGRTPASFNMLEAIVQKCDISLNWLLFDIGPIRMTDAWEPPISKLPHHMPFTVLPDEETPKPQPSRLRRLFRRMFQLHGAEAV